jgi:hypothetical protein
LRRAFLLLVAASVCLGCWVGSADADVYWSSLSVVEPGVGAIGHADPDGSGVDQALVTGLNWPLWLAADDAHVYWAGSEGIGRANLDGSGATPGFVSVPGGYYQAVAVDGSHIYWTDDVAGTIGRANLDGSDVEADFITGGENPIGVTVDSGHVYWVDAEGASLESIGRANLDGSGVDQTFIDMPSTSDLCGVAVDSSHIYWSDEANDEIGRAGLDGSGVEPDWIEAEGPCELALDGDHILWVGEGSQAIGRAGLEGSGNEPVFIGMPEGSYATGVAVNGLGGGGSPPSTAPATPTAPAPIEGQAGQNENPKAPNTILRSHPKAKVKAPRGKAKVRFAFRSDQPGARFRCALDRRKLKPCASPVTYRVKPGRHTFRVEAVTAQGTDPTPARFAFKVVRVRNHAKPHGRN